MTVLQIAIYIFATNRGNFTANIFGNGEARMCNGIYEIRARIEAGERDRSIYRQIARQSLPKMVPLTI